MQILIMWFHAIKLGNVDEKAVQLGLEVCPFTESLVIRQTDLRLVAVKGLYTQLCGRKGICTLLCGRKGSIYTTLMTGRKGIIDKTLWS